jgi:hypothetical protein
MSRVFYHERTDPRHRDQPTRLHVIREDHPSQPGGAGHCNLPLRPGSPQTVVLADMPVSPPPGFAWCPICIGNLAAALGMLDHLARFMAAVEINRARDGLEKNS